MGKKPGKAHWRRGVVVSREGESDQPAREDMTLKFMRAATSESDPERKEQHLLGAQIAQVLGSINEGMVDLSTYRPGRPKGERLAALDLPMIEFMERERNRTGESRKHTLARLATERADLPEAHRPAAIKRLVRLWKKRHGQN